MRKILSFLFPVTRRIKTPRNGVLEVTWSGGRKYLDSENANYSYGSLQRILEIGIRKIPVQQDWNVLLLGMGGGSIIRPLIDEFGVHGKITAIDFDPVVIDIANSEFGISESSALKIINADASAFVNDSKEQFNLIIIDLFIDYIVPDTFYKGEFWSSLTKLVANGGWFLFNAGVRLKPDSLPSELLSQLNRDFEVSIHNNVEGTNTLIIGNKR